MQTDRDLYSEDFHAWIKVQAELLRSGRLQAIDSALLAEELEAMGRRERNELVSRLIILIAHLLEWESGRARINEQSSSNLRQNPPRH